MSNKLKNSILVGHRPGISGWSKTIIKIVAVIFCHLSVMSTIELTNINIVVPSVDWSVMKNDLDDGKSGFYIFLR